MQTFTRALLGILAAAMAIGLVIFGVQNTQSVRIQFLNFATEGISVSLLVIGAVIFGAGLMWIVGLFGAAQRSLRQMRNSRERSALESRNSELEQKVANLEKELSSLRPAPPPEAKASGKPAARQ